MFLPENFTLEILRLFVKADVAIEEEIADLVHRTVEEFGRLDFAFNNAGISLDAGDLRGNYRNGYDSTDSRR